MKIQPHQQRSIALPTELKTDTKKTTQTAETQKKEAPRTVEDAFDAMPTWKKSAVVAAGIAGMSAGAVIGERLGLGIVSDMIPHLSMVAYSAIPLASMLGAALVGTAAGVMPFFGEQEWS